MEAILLMLTQNVILAQENAAKTNRLLEDMSADKVRKNSSSDSMAAATLKVANDKLVLANTKSFCANVVSQIDRDSILFLKFVSGKATDSKRDQEVFLLDIFNELVRSSASEDISVLATIALQKGMPSGFSDIRALMAALELAVLHANLVGSAHSMQMIEQMYLAHFDQQSRQLFKQFSGTIKLGTSVLQQLVLFLSYCKNESFTIRLTSDPAVSPQNVFVATGGGGPPALASATSKVVYPCCEKVKGFEFPRGVTGCTGYLQLMSLPCKHKYVQVTKISMCTLSWGAHDLPIPTAPHLAYTCKSLLKKLSPCKFNLSPLPSLSICQPNKLTNELTN